MAFHRSSDIVLCISLFTLTHCLSLPVLPKQMNKAYIFQSSLILYFFNAAGKTFQHGSSRVTRNDFAALFAASLAFDFS